MDHGSWRHDRGVDSLCGLPGFEPVLDLEDVSALIDVVLPHDQGFVVGLRRDHTGVGLEAERS